MKKIVTAVATLLVLSNTPTFAQWQKVTDPSLNNVSNCLLSNKGKLYVAANSGVFVSTDNGETWTDTDSKSVSDGMAPKFLASTANVIYAAGVSGGSGNYASPLKYDGQHWTADTAGLPLAEIKTMFSDDNRIFIARVGNTELCLYTKLDNETRWTPVTSIPVPNAIFGMYKINNTYYAVTGGYKKIWSSTDGVSFTETASSVPSDVRTFFSAPGAVYFGSEHGLFKSTDGLTFNRIDAGFAAHPAVGLVGINAIHVSGNAVYASAVYSDSVYKSTDGGTTWSSISDGVLTNTVTSITMHNNAIFATQFTWGADKAPVIRYGTPSSGLFEKASNPIQVTLHPNPSSGVVHVDVKENARLSLYNLAGTLQLNTTGNRMDVSGLAKGIYFLQVNTSAGKAIQKLLVE
ncbi:MAG: T9SS type A sorting domain-containing protein [Bacteroidota bacterium]